MHCPVDELIAVPEEDQRQYMAECICACKRIIFDEQSNILPVDRGRSLAATYMDIQGELR